MSGPSVITPDRVQWGRRYIPEVQAATAVPLDADQNVSGETVCFGGSRHIRVGAMFMGGTGGPFGIYPAQRTAYRLYELILSYRLVQAAGGDATLMIRYDTASGEGAYLLLSRVDFDEAREDPGTRHIVIPCHGLISQNDYPMVTIQYSNTWGTVSWLAEEVNRI